jgi:hypothetical protein
MHNRQNPLDSTYFVPILADKSVKVLSFSFMHVPIGYMGYLSYALAHKLIANIRFDYRFPLVVNINCFIHRCKKD